MRTDDFSVDSPSSIGKYQFGGIARNLQIRVELNYIGTSFGNLPSFSQFAERLAERSQRNFDHQHSIVEQSSGEITTVKWQQKIHQPNSNFEPVHIEESVQRPENPQSVEGSPPPSDPRHNNENEENKPVHSRAPRPLPRIRTSAQSRVFTYIDSDPFVQQTKSAKTSNQNDENPTVFRPRKVAPLSTSTIRHPVRETQTPEQHKKQRSFVPAQQKMFIMGYFGAWNEPYNVDNERVLCEVQLFGHRIMQMKPDQGVHNIDTKIGHYRYQLSVENYVDFDEIPSSLIDEEQTDNMADEQFKFQLPEKQSTYLQYLITIEEAINFPFDGLYIEYELDLPPNFYTDNQCSGRTQLCFTQPFGSNDIARFSFPFELDLTYKDDSNEMNEPFRWPRLLFRVLAEDQWQRYYVAGYGSIALPTTPTTGQKCPVECWRPVNPYSSLCKLREQFIGQAVDLQKNDSTNSKMALIDLSKTFSKIGISAESSGTIVLSVSCMRQSRHYISQQVMRTLKYGRFITQIGLDSNLYYRITRVLLQFEETKRQLIRLRKQRLPAAPRGSIAN